MKYIALLRGINVGGNHKVSMAELKVLLENLGYTNVSTYLNSGNAIFDSDSKPNAKALIKKLENTFGFEVPTLIKSASEIDNKDIIKDLPFKIEFIDVRYTPGALLWNVERTDYSKSKLNEIIKSKLYKYMTIRNVNTARYLGQITT